MGIDPGKVVNAPLTLPFPPRKRREREMRCSGVSPLALVAGERGQGLGEYLGLLLRLPICEPNGYFGFPFGLIGVVFGTGQERLIPRTKPVAVNGVKAIPHDTLLRSPIQQGLIRLYPV